MGHADFGQLFACECKQRRYDAERFTRFLRMSNLGSLAEVTFDSLFTPTQDGSGNTRLAQALETGRMYAERPSGWLAIIGPSGTGKTHLAAAVATEAIRRGVPAFFITVADLLDHLRSAYAPTSEVTYDELFDQVKRVPLLVLDDLGRHSATPWAEEKLSQILGHRHNSRAATVITTDLPLDALDEGLRTRLQDTSMVTLLQTGQPRRAGTLTDVLDFGDVAHMTFQTFDPNGLGMTGPLRQNLIDAKKLAVDYSEHPDGWLVLLGRYGSGKTHLAAAIAHDRRRRGDDVSFVLVPELLDYLRSTFNTEKSSYEVLNQVKRVGLLVLDDFSEPVESDWTREKLYEILNFRYLTKLPTVITSSKDIDDLERDVRIWSRMRDPRVSTVYEIMAPDYRTGIAHKPRQRAEAERRRRSSRPAQQA